MGLLLQSDDTEAAEAPPQTGSEQQVNGTAAGQSQQAGGELSTAAAKLVAEVVASPVFYLIAGE